MLTDDQFFELMKRTKNGDQDAARRLVAEYEPEIRRAARLRLTNSKLRRIVDSIDICQSVFGRFFASATSDAFHLESPTQLLMLLTTMTRNRVIDEHRRQTTAKRAANQVAEALEMNDFADDSPGPRTAAAAKELLTEVRSRLSADELAIADRRNAGHSWDEIATDLNASPDSLRKRLERALQRVRNELNDNEA
jgi:RNA polymerase sigma-70 factor (ECF subfamily)